MEQLLHSAVVVSEESHVRRLIEIMLDAEPSDAKPSEVVFVERAAHAFSLITRVAPDVVIVSLEIGDADAFRLLSMLTLDKRTRQIPVVIRTTRPEAEVPPATLPKERASTQIIGTGPMN